MGELVAVIGNTGSGKTTLTRLLCRDGGFTPLLEQHAERPFQAQFARERRHALANQMDYLLYRAAQEVEARRGSGVFITDGGLDQDFYVFTRLFHEIGYLPDAEYDLCERFYSYTRALLPMPERYILLTAPLEELARRRLARMRGSDAAPLEELERIEVLIARWLGEVRVPVLCVDTAGEDEEFSTSMGRILAAIPS